MHQVSQRVFHFSLLVCEMAGVRLRKILRDFRPEAIVTAAHFYSWITAAKVARDLNVPLHLIVHDDWPAGVTVARFAAEWPSSKFAEIYRQSRSLNTGV